MLGSEGYFQRRIVLGEGGYSEPEIILDILLLLKFNSHGKVVETIK